MLAREEAEQQRGAEQAEQQRQADQSRAKLEREAQLAAEMILEEEQALVLDGEERRLWRIAEEEAAVERLKEKERIALEYAGKAPAEEVVGEEGCGAGEGKAQKSDEVTE